MAHGYAEIIAALYPGVPFNTHTDPDKETLDRIETEKVPNFWMTNNMIVEWLDPDTAMPAKEDILAGVDKATSILDAAAAAQQ